MLILFDIDATLLTSGGVGITAMGRAGRELFGEHFNERSVEYAGRIDPLIIGDLLKAHDLDITADAVQSFREGYGKHLRELLAETNTAEPCPGVPELLDRFDAHEEIVLGLLTGNFPETGQVKLRAGGIDPDRFEIRVWGSDSPHDPPAREHLPGVGISRFHERFDRAINGEQVVVIGDTPHDISCARAHQCASIGVGTGRFTPGELTDAGADLAVDDLSDVAMIGAWIENRLGARSVG